MAHSTQFDEDILYPKDPDAVLPFGRDWTEWLIGEGGDTLNTSVWTVDTVIPGDPSPLTIAGSPAPSHDDTITIFWLTGGTPGNIYHCRNRITTVGGRTDDRTFRVKILQR